MSTLPDLLAPIAPPATTDRAAPKARSTADEEAPRFADRLERERADNRAPEGRERTESADAAEASQPPESAEADVAATEDGADAGKSAGEATQETGQATAEDDSAVGDQTADAAVATLVDPSLIVDGDATPDALTVTASTGETVPLTPPQAASAGDPGALGRWFAQVSGPVDGPMAHSAGLLNKLATQTSQQAFTGAAVDGALPTTSLDAAGRGTAMSFADAMSGGATASSAMANSFMDSESLDALVTQAMAKASAALEPGGANAPSITTGQTVATGAQAAMTAVPQAATGQAVPVTALAVEITRQAMNGKTQFDIRLDPPELGRLTVRLEMDASGQTRTHMVVERAETLEMLSTDARSLERALQQAGLKSEPGSVSFELAQDAADGFTQDGQSASADDQSGETGNGDPSALNVEDPSLAETIASPEAIRQQLYVTGHLDVRI